MLKRNKSVKHENNTSVESIMEESEFLYQATFNGDLPAAAVFLDL